MVCDVTVLFFIIICVYVLVVTIHACMHVIDNASMYKQVPDISCMACFREIKNPLTGIVAR